MYAILSLMEGFVSAVTKSITVSISLTAKMSSVCFLWFITLSKLAIGPWIVNAILLVIVLMG
jgi:hypothetical protein